MQDAEDPKGHQRYCFLFKSRILVCKVRRISEDRSVFVLKDIIRVIYFSHFTECIKLRIILFSVQ